MVKRRIKSDKIGIKDFPKSRQVLTSFMNESPYEIRQ